MPEPAPPKIRPAVDAALAARGGDASIRRTAARALVAAVWQHPPTRRAHYVEYIAWRLLEAPAAAGPPVPNPKGGPPCAPSA